MKIRYYFCTGLILLLLSACQDKIDETTIPKKGDQTGYLSLSLDVSHTRTASTTTEPGIASESVINNITIALTDASGNILYAENPTVTDGVTEKISVALGEYYVYALVNKPDDITIAPGSNIERVVEVASGTDAKKGYKGGLFFMVNRRNGSSETAGVLTEVSSNNTINNPAMANIQVDRAAVKIVWDQQPDLDFDELLNIDPNLFNQGDLRGFALLNCKKDFNLIQKWSTDNYGGSLTLGEEVLNTPMGTRPLLADNYFDNISKYTELKKDTNGKVTEIVDKLKDIEPMSMLIYTTENRPTIMKNASGMLTAGMGEATGVIFKVRLLKDDSPINTFFEYKGYIYTSVNELNDLADFQSDPLPDGKANYPKVRARGVYVYEDAIMYYTYFIRDPNTNYQFDGKDYYAVFRNSVYKLSITKFSGLGDDVPGGRRVDPNEPGESGNPLIDPDKSYIRASVEINPWAVNLIGIDF